MGLVPDLFRSTIMKYYQRPLHLGGLALVLAGALVTSGAMNAAADVTRTPDDGYKVGETAQDSGAQPADRVSDNTVRVARFEVISGKVTWRPDSNHEWAAAKTSVVLRQGAEIGASDGARAEIRFSDGSLVRVGNGVIVLKSLFSDDQGEYTEVHVQSGLMTVLPRQQRSVFEVTTPTISVKTAGPSRVRIGVTDVVDVAVRKGRAVVEGRLGKTTLVSTEFLSLRPSDKEYVVQSLPPPDSWERWNDERDRILFGTYRSATYRPAYYPPSVWFSLDIPVSPERHRSREGRRRW
jgi:hypothetical protein